MKNDFSFKFTQYTMLEENFQKENCMIDKREILPNHTISDNHSKPRDIKPLHIILIVNFRSK